MKPPRLAYSLVLLALFTTLMALSLGLFHVLATLQLDLPGTFVQVSMVVLLAFLALLVLRYFGRAGIQERIRAHVELARELASWVDAAPGWERVAPVPFSTVVYRWAPEGSAPEEKDRLNRRIMDAVNETGKAFLSHTVLEGRFCLRLALGNLRTTKEHLIRTWELIQGALV